MRKIEREQESGKGSAGEREWEKESVRERVRESKREIEVCGGERERA